MGGAFWVPGGLGFSPCFSVYSDTLYLRGIFASDLGDVAKKLYVGLINYEWNEIHPVHVLMYIPRNSVGV
jgi:hypothetical protein